MVVGCYEMPQQVTYVALHNDYSEEFEPSTSIPEDRCGEIAVDRLFKGNRGHYGPAEHAHLTLATRFDHNTVMQLRTHRVGVSFDLQSQRYTGARIEQVARGERPVEEVFFFRPLGTYSDRDGEPYEYTEAMLNGTKEFCICASQRYLALRSQGAAEEHARGVLPTCYYQNAVITGNIRSWFHLLDVRHKLDAQLEARWAMERILEKVSTWVPEIWSWYEKARLSKAILAP